MVHVDHGQVRGPFGEDRLGLVQSLRGSNHEHAVVERQLDEIDDEGPSWSTRTRRASGANCFVSTMRTPNAKPATFALYGAKYCTPTPADGINIESIVIATLGAIAVIIVYRAMSRSRGASPTG